MLKFKIDTDGFDALSDEHKTFYAQQGEEYVLQVDGAPDPDELDRLRKHSETLLAEKKAKDEQARQALAEKQQAEREAAIKSGDAERIQKTLNEQLEAERGEKERLKKQIDNDKLKRTVERLSSKLTNEQHNQDILNVLLERQVTVSDGELSITGLNGEQLESIEQLEQQVVSSGRFDSLLVGTRSSGSGGQGQGSKSIKDPQAMSAIERKQLKDSDPAAFARLFPS